MLQFLETYLSDILGLVETVIFCLVAFVLTHKLGNPKFLQGAFDVIMQKYKTEQTVKKTVGQKFEHTAPVYELDAETGELVQTDKVINIDELVNSSKDQALNSIYDRFLPDDVERASAVFYSHASKEATLQGLRETYNLVEQYREKYSLPDDMEAVDVLTYVEKTASKLKEQAKHAKQVEETEKKGGEVNA